MNVEIFGKTLGTCGHYEVDGESLDIYYYDFEPSELFDYLDSMGEPHDEYDGLIVNIKTGLIKGFEERSGETFKYGEKVQRIFKGY